MARGQSAASRGALSPIARGARKAASASATQLVLSNQASEALALLGKPMEPTSRLDPKLVLLEAVRSAHQQREVWEAMLAGLPHTDWSLIGSIPVPGSPSSARGARVEVVAKHLAEATKTAARTSKLAIDAGIEERLVRLAEEQSALIADTVKAAVIAAIGSMRLSAQAEAAAINAALGAAATHLRSLAAGPDSAARGQTEIIDGIATVVSRKAV